jgi:adiponectin receptor
MARRTITSAPLEDSQFLTESSAATSKPDNQSYWPTIGSKDLIPGWLRDNDYILEGHPMPTYSYKRSLRLWRCLHMETMNIWIHLVGSMAFIAVGFTLKHSVTRSQNLTFTRGDVFAFGSFIASAIVCFGLSAGFHTLRSHSYNIHHLWGRMDILGICFLALGAGTSMTYYAFFCRPFIQRVYWGLNLFSAIGAGITLFDTGGGGNKMRTLRGGVFSLLAISAMLPILHSVIELGWTRASNEIGACWYLAEALSLLTGVSVFVCRFPERLSPGTFDIWGHSHQLWHTFAVLGGAFHVVALVAAYNYRRMHNFC